MSAPEAAAVTARRLAAHLQRRARWRWPEIVFWLAILALIFALPSRAGIINEVLIAGLFALSLDLILGLTGIVSLGHAAFLGLGAYSAAILASKGFAEPALGLAFGAAVAAVVGLVSAPLLLRGGDLTRLMVTLGVSLMLGELANRNSWITGGADGLNFSMAPVLGLFPIGFTGQRNAALYSFAVLFILFAIARRLAHSPFGLALAAIRENRLRAGALGVDTSRRIVAIYTIAAAYAGAAGALLAQTTQIVSLDLFDFHRSADVMLMLIIGGAGYLYGGLIGAAAFIVLRDVISAATPEYWEFWIGLALVVLVLAGRDRHRRGGEAHDRPRRAARRGPGLGLSAPALEARGLMRHFGALVATDDVSFAIRPGARQALIGPNGAGKTTLINLLTGVIKPTAGQVLLQGRDVTHLKPSARVRMGLSRTFQINQLFPDLTPAESLGLAISERNGAGADFWRVAGGRPEIVGRNRRAAGAFRPRGRHGQADAEASLRQAAAPGDRARAGHAPARAAARRTRRRRAGGGTAGHPRSPRRAALGCRDPPDRARHGPRVQFR